MAWTVEQQLAIDKVGKNIIVSAGAGSGKTAVLTARVLAHLKRGVHIHELLILTFTKAAASEMKERIRSSIKKEESLWEELTTLDEAYITTFDSFSLSIVKKYHYLLNLPRNPKITDETMISLLRKECMRQVFDQLYEEENAMFMQFVDTFCGKEDELLLEEVLQVARKLETKRDVLDYLKHYQEIYYQESFIQKCLADYEKKVLFKREELKEELEEFSYIAPKEYMDKVESSLALLFESREYDELYALKSSRLPSLPRGVDDEVKIGKEKVNEKLKELKELFRFGTLDDLRRDYLQTQGMMDCLLLLLNRYFSLYLAEKKKRGYYDFQTIAFYALQLLEDYPNVLEELKGSFKEIMVDEYQDTNDLQEAFLALLNQNNLYMVGDIKQSIYRFRNANPYLFKNKYDAYANDLGGMKIDLLANFRSRKEVLQNINLLFNPLMDDEIGGANYQVDHQMNFGNMLYEQEKRTDQNYNMEFYMYPVLKGSSFSKEEIEIFFIVQDIQKRISNKEQVFDKKTGTLRTITYQDICILLDRTKDFDLYRKIFLYFEVPLTLYKDEVLSTNIHFMTLKNCFFLLAKLRKKEFDADFRFCLASLSRGFLFREEDETLYQILKNHRWYDAKAVSLLKPILQGIDAKALEVVLDEILQVTEYYQKLITIGNIEESMVVLEKLKGFAVQAAGFGYTYESFGTYLDEILTEELEVKYRPAKEDLDSVKIMTIHKSKGLEFPICYFAGLSKKFNIGDLKERFLWDATYGILTPISKEGIQDTFVKDLVKDEYLKEEISEKIRLFYVALTRAREKMIFVCPNGKDFLGGKTDGVVSNLIRYRYRSFADFIYSLKRHLSSYTQILSLENLGLTKEYLNLKEKNFRFFDAEKLLVQEWQGDVSAKEEKRTFSKHVTSLLRKEDKRNIEFGKTIHEYLQFLSFSNPQFDCITDPFIAQKVKALWNQALIQEHLQDQFYQEYEFYDEENGILAHGIIDLLIVNAKEAIVIDYKLDHVLDEAYKKQLEGYSKYVKRVFQVPVTMYLYSILEETFTFVDI